MNLQANEFATVDLSPEKSSVNKGTKQDPVPILLRETGTSHQLVNFVYVILRVGFLTQRYLVTSFFLEPVGKEGIRVRCFSSTRHEACTMNRLSSTARISFLHGRGTSFLL
jgi:hypothetical protein